MNGTRVQSIDLKKKKNDLLSAPIQVEVLMRLQMQRSRNMEAMAAQESTFSFADEQVNSNRREAGPNQKTTPKEMIPTAIRIPR